MDKYVGIIYLKDAKPGERYFPINIELENGSKPDARDVVNAKIIEEVKNKNKLWYTAAILDVMTEEEFNDGFGNK